MRKPLPPPPETKRFREIIHSGRFESERSAIEPDIRRMDEKMRGVEWVLARQPEFGKRTNKAGIFAISTSGINDGNCVIYYSFDEDRVVLEAILAAKQNEN